MATKLTESALRKVEAPTDGRGYVIVYDSEVRGLGLRITKADARSWILTYRTRQGRERRYTIGQFANWPLSAAREEGRRLRRIVDQGGDPLQQLATERAAATVNELADRYLAEHAPRLRASSRRDVEDNLKKWVRPELGKMKVIDVRHTDVERLHQKITAYGTPYRANRTMSLMSKLFNLSIKWEMRADNPVKGIERNQEQKRTRYLHPAEIARLAVALDTHPSRAAANAIRLLLLTGARRGEVLGAKWDALDLQTGVWVKPGSTTKQKTEHRVPLSAPALQLLVGIHVAALKAAKDAGHDAEISSFVFPSPNGKHLSNIKTSWLSVCKRAGLVNKIPKLSKNGKPIMGREGVPVFEWKTTARIHDLRHSYASILASAGLSLPIIGALLGHSQQATTARYAHLMDDPLRAATDRAAAIIGAAGVGGDVVPMTRRA